MSGEKQKQNLQIPEWSFEKKSVMFNTMHQRAPYLHEPGRALALHLVLNDPFKRSDRGIERRAGKVYKYCPSAQ